MNAKKQITLEQLFRLYPQLRRTTHQQAAHAQDGQGGGSTGMTKVPASQAGQLAEA